MLAALLRRRVHARWGTVTPFGLIGVNTSLPIPSTTGPRGESEGFRVGLRPDLGFWGTGAGRGFVLEPYPAALALAQVQAAFGGRSQLAERPSNFICHTLIRRGDTD